ncbi:HTH CENPB-type domain-containing protein [Aphelenchoides besseyi]|nr:HTH CENPB-type domain-containing protein [Aphelenchoides besseyi]
MSSDNSSDIENVPPASKKKRQQYDVKTKLEVVDYAKRNSNQKTAKEFGVGRSSVQDWRRQKDELKALRNSNSRKRRLPGAGRPLTNATFDDQLIEWVKNERTLKHPVSRRLISNHARSLLEKTDLSTGWMSSFISRHRLTSRRRTSTCQKLPSEYAQKIVDFILSTNRLIATKHFNGIYAADETAVSLDPVGGLVIDSKGVKDVTCFLGF